jgi:hypothetical protein
MTRIKLWITVMLGQMSGLGAEFAAAELKVAMPGPIGTREVSIQRSESSISLPAFVDDLMIHITLATTQ